MYRKTAIMSAACVIALSVFSAQETRANSGPTPRFHSLIQRGQDIYITLAIPDDGYLLASDPYTLVREEEGKSKAIFENKIFWDSKEAAVDFEQVCDRNYDYNDEVDCTATSEKCRDCDGDGAPECYMKDYCDWYGLYQVVDECVTPGKVVYSIRNERRDYAQDSKNIVVSDAGEDCLESSGADGGISCNDCEASAINRGSSNNAGDHNHGCNVTSVEIVSTTQWTLVFFMLGVGLLAFGVAHRRNERRPDLGGD